MKVEVEAQAEEAGVVEVQEVEAGEVEAQVVESAKAPALEEVTTRRKVTYLVYIILMGKNTHLMVLIEFDVLNKECFF